MDPIQLFEKLKNRSKIVINKNQSIVIFETLEKPKDTQKFSKTTDFEISGQGFKNRPIVIDRTFCHSLSPKFRGKVDQT